MYTCSLQGVPWSQRRYMHWTLPAGLRVQCDCLASIHLYRLHLLLCNACYVTITKPHSALLYSAMRHVYPINSVINLAIVKVSQ